VFVSRFFRFREARPITLATSVYLQSRGQQVEATRPNETIGFFVFFLAAVRMWRTVRARPLTVMSRLRLWGGAMSPRELLSKA
jgi:hypothetical protein